MVLPTATDPLTSRPAIRALAINRSANNMVDAGQSRSQHGGRWRVTQPTAPMWTGLGYPG